MVGQACVCGGNCLPGNKAYLIPNPEKGKPPLVLYPDECWYCGTGVIESNHPGAVELLHPLHQSISVIWKNKESGEKNRLGINNPPPPKTKPPVDNEERRRKGQKLDGERKLLHPISKGTDFQGGKTESQGTARFLMMC